MTERFTETISTMTVTDNQTGREYKCEMGIDTDLLELLNMLHEENQQLQGRLETYRVGCREIYDDKCKLEKENEQLKQQIKELQIENEAQSDAIDGLQELLAHMDLGDVE